MGFSLWWRVTGPVSAHGGGTLQIANAPVGDCLISVWSAPPSPRAGSPLHITVGAAQAESGEPVLDATVQVLVRPGAAEAPLATAQATTDQSINKLFYEADLPELAAGTYQLEVVTDCGGVVDVVSFSLTIRPSLNPLFVVVPIGLGLLLLVVLIWRGWLQRDTAVEPIRKRRRK